MTQQAVAPQHPLGTVLASARRLTAADVGMAGGGKRRKNSQLNTTAWQAEARNMFRLVGEFAYVVTTLAGRVGQAKLYIGEIDPEDPSSLPQPVENNDEVQSIIDTFGGTYAGRSQLLVRLAINLLVPGDGWLCGIPDWLAHPDDATEVPEPGTSVPLSSLEWRMLSTDEVKISQGELKLRLDNYSDPVTVMPDQVYLVRVWNPDPFEWWQATSTARANLPVLKELVGLTMHVSAQVDSRLAGAGVFLVPQSAQRALQIAAGVEEGSATDEFTEALIEAMITPISDRSSAAAVVPLVVTVPDDVIDKFRHISFATELDGEARELRQEAIQRLALGLDAPPEVLLGTADSNHWGSWFADSDTVSSHIEPLLALICDALTTQYLWPVMREQGEKDPERYVFWYDVSHLITQPNRTQDAMALFDKGVISDVALRRELGFDDADAPEEDDPAKAAILEMVQSNPGMLRSPALPQMIEALQLIVSGQMDKLAKKMEAEAEKAKAEEPPPTSTPGGPPAPEPTTPPPAAAAPVGAPPAAPGAAPVGPGQGGIPRRLPQEVGPPRQPVLTSPVG